jgi:hypothetical protein
VTCSRAYTDPTGCQAAWSLRGLDGRGIGKRSETSVTVSPSLPVYSNVIV